MRIAFICLFTAMFCCGCTDPDQAARTSKNQREMYETGRQAMREAKEAGMSVEEAKEHAIKAQLQGRESQEAAEREND